MPFNEPTCHKCGEFLPAPGARCPFCAAYQPKKHYLDDNPQEPLRGHDEYDYPKSLDDVFICKKCGAHKTHYRLRGYRCDSCDNKDE